MKIDLGWGPCWESAPSSTGPSGYNGCHRSGGNSWIPSARWICQRPEMPKLPHSWTRLQPWWLTISRKCTVWYHLQSNVVGSQFRSKGNKKCPQATPSSEFFDHPCVVFDPWKLAWIDEGVSVIKAWHRCSCLTAISSGCKKNHALTKSQGRGTLEIDSW